MSHLLRRLLLISILGVSVWYVVTHRAEFGLLLEVDLRYLPGLIAVHGVSVFANGLIMRILLARFDVELSFVEWFGLTVLHSFGNYLPVPQAGSVARGVYLKKRHGLGYARFVAVIAVAYVQFLATAGLLGCGMLALLALRGHGLSWPLLVVFAALPAFSLGTVLLARHPALRERLGPFTDAMTRLNRDRTLSRVAALQLALIAAVAIGLSTAFAALGETVSVHSALLVALTTTASGVANVTPGNVGVAEASAWLTARIVGTDADQTVVAYALFRLSAILTVLALMPPFAFRLHRDARGVRPPR